MARTRITSKGQITLPKAVRDEMGLRPGDEVEFVKDNGAYRLQRVIGASVFEKWRGYLTEWEGCDVDDMIEEMRGR
jgi:AbrB family looped-hinge helix DNA binding protein